MTEKINPETYFIIKIYTFEYYVKFSFWVSVYYERCRLTETLLNDEVGNQIDIKDYYLLKIIHVLKTIISCSFPIQLKSATGLLLEGSDLSPFLKIGITFASFHISGNIPS